MCSFLWAWEVFMLRTRLSFGISNYTVCISGKGIKIAFWLRFGSSIRKPCHFVCGGIHGSYLDSDSRSSEWNFHGLPQSPPDVSVTVTQVSLWLHPLRLSQFITRRLFRHSTLPRTIVQTGPVRQQGAGQHGNCPGRQHVTGPKTSLV